MSGPEWIRVDSCGFLWVGQGYWSWVVQEKRSRQERGAASKQVAARSDQARKGKARLGKATNPDRILGNLQATKNQFDKAWTRQRRRRRQRRQRRGAIRLDRGGKVAGCVCARNVHTDPRKDARMIHNDSTGLCNGCRRGGGGDGRWWWRAG